MKTKLMSITLYVGMVQDINPPDGNYRAKPVVVSSVSPDHALKLLADWQQFHDSTGSIYRNMGVYTIPPDFAKINAILVNSVLGASSDEDETETECNES